MSCKHEVGDRNCTRQFGQNTYTSLPSTPDKENYTIEEIIEENNHIILKVKYPNCSNCSFEGTKILVFFNLKIKDICLWNEIDPHFRDKDLKNIRKAPSPDARFPASKNGWKNAIALAKIVK